MKNSYLTKIGGHPAHTITLNGKSEERILALLQGMESKKLVTQLRKQLAEAEEAEATASDEPAKSSKKDARKVEEPAGASLPGIELATMLHVCDPAVAWAHGETLVDILGNEIAEGTDGVLLVISTPESAKKIYTQSEFRFVVDYTNEIQDDFAAYCATIRKAYKVADRLIEKKEFMLVSEISGDESMKAVVEFERATGISHKKSKAILNWKAPIKRRKDKDGKTVSFTPRTWRDDLIADASAPKPTVDKKRCTAEFREHIRQLIKNNTYTRRQLASEERIKNVLRDFEDQQQADAESAAQTASAPPDGGGENPPTDAGQKAA